MIKGGLRGTLECGTVQTGGGGFDFEVQFGEGAVMKHIHAVLHDFWERCEHVLDCGRVDVHAAHDDHVVVCAVPPRRRSDVWLTMAEELLLLLQFLLLLLLLQFLLRARQTACDQPKLELECLIFTQ